MNDLQDLRPLLVNVAFSLPMNLGAPASLPAGWRYENSPARMPALPEEGHDLGEARESETNHDTFKTLP